MPFRTSAKPKEKPKELLYSRPWWRLWLPKAQHTYKGQKYIWKYLRRWKCNSEVSGRKDFLYYTSNGNWVFTAWTYRRNDYGETYENTWNWFIYNESIEGIKRRLQSKKNWNANEEDREQALKIFKRLVKIKDGDLNLKGEQQI